MRSVLLLFAAVTLVMPPATLGAQEMRGPDPRRLLASFGLSSGSAALTCTFCSEDGKGSIAGTLGVETRLRSNVLVGLEVQWWRYSGGGMTRSVAAVAPTMQIYLFPRRIVFLKGGLGIGRFAASSEEEELNTTAMTALVGAGVEFRVSPQYAVVPYVSWLSGGGGTMRLNGAEVTGRSGMSLRQIGLAIAMR